MMKIVSKFEHLKPKLPYLEQPECYVSEPILFLDGQPTAWLFVFNDGEYVTSYAQHFKSGFSLKQVGFDGDLNDFIDEFCIRCMQDLSVE